MRAQAVVIASAMAIGGWAMAASPDSRGIRPPGAQANTSVVNVDAIGPRVGEALPPFELPDTTGRLRTLASVAGSAGTLVVFFRSADW
ncbi:MAG: hypothetical protein U0Q12_24325 [Vicinamibacterales bacterium]